MSLSRKFSSKDENYFSASNDVEDEAMDGVGMKFTVL
jgi:hypothetical protein